MTLRLTGTTSSLLCALGFLAFASDHSSAQYSQPSLAKLYESGWENDRLRVRAVSVEPGARLEDRGDVDRVLVFLTADLEGRMPPADAIWQSAGGPALENHGRLRVNAIVIDVKSGPPSGIGMTSPEALPSTDGIESRLLIDNAHVIVSRLRYAANAYLADPWHFHPQDALVVYLSGGYTWLPYGGWGLPTRVHRGDIDVVPANTFHSFRNAGSDPLEFLVIMPK